METKTLSEWAKDPRINLKKRFLWLAIKSGHLKATRPVGAKKWRIAESDLMAYLNGGNNENKDD